MGRYVEELSQLVFKAEDEFPEGTDYSDFDAHPLVLGLKEEMGDDAVKAALAFLVQAPDERGVEVNAAVLVRWMKDGAFKGRYFSDAVFCRDHFAGGDEGGSLMSHFATWDGAARGFTRWPGLSPAGVGDLFDWQEWARQAMNREGAAFYSIMGMSGNYVFDVSVGFDDYEDTGWGECRWMAGCNRMGRTQVRHRISGPLAACQQCADRAALNPGSC